MNLNNQELFAKLPLELQLCYMKKQWNLQSDKIRTAGDWAEYVHLSDDSESASKTLADINKEIYEHMLIMNRDIIKPLMLETASAVLKCVKESKINAHIATICDGFVCVNKKTVPTYLLKKDDQVVIYGNHGECRINVLEAEKTNNVESGVIKLTEDAILEGTTITIRGDLYNPISGEFDNKMEVKVNYYID